MLTTLLKQERQQPLTWTEDRNVDCTIAQWLSQLQHEVAHLGLDPETTLAYWSNWK